MVGYPSTYQALVDDVLDHRLNRVTVQMEGKNGQGKRAKTYDVDAESVSGHVIVPNHAYAFHLLNKHAAVMLLRYAAGLEDA